MFKLLILFSFLGCFSVDAARPDSLDIKFTSAETLYNENPYFGEAIAKVNEGGKDVDLTIVVKEDGIPEDTMLHMHLERNNAKAKDFKMRLCDAPEEAILGKYAFGNMIPKSFSCPASPGSYTMKNYTPDQTFLPTSFVGDGPFKVVITTASPKGDKYTIGIFEGELSHSGPIPSIGIM